MVNEQNNAGIVYILSNPAMEEYIKIGWTNGDSVKDVQDRMRQLDSTGVPRAFNCEYAAIVKDPYKIEQALHTAFGDFRVRANREFFENVAPFRVKAVLELFCIREVTPGVATDELVPVVDDVPEKAARAERFKFSMAQVPLDAVLQWADDPTIECKVIDENNHIEYQGKRYTISGLARDLKPGWKSAQGSKYWLYKEETLQERRERLDREAEEFQQ